MSSQRCGFRQRGYTLVELVLVIVILGILGTVAGPKFFGRSDFDDRAWYDELASAMRYGQKVATASGCPVQVTITGTSYALTQQTSASGHCNSADGSYPKPVLLPSGDAIAGSAPSGASVSPATSFIFDAQGRTSLGADQTFVVGSRTMTVRAGSGLVITQ